MDKIVSKYGNAHIQTGLDLIHAFSLQDAKCGQRGWIILLQNLPGKKQTKSKANLGWAKPGSAWFDLLEFLLLTLFMRLLLFQTNYKLSRL